MSERDLKFTGTHEWIRVEGDEAVVGLSDYAQGELGDIVFVELPEAGRVVSKDEALTTLESVKSVSEVYAPLTGEITGVNAALEDDPGLINTDPLGKGWIFRMKLADASELSHLMSAEAYAEHTKG
jgi:glycine cleavage system H protein